MFTKKHFEMVARVLYPHRESGAIHADLVKQFALEFKKSNPRFDIAKFYEAAGRAVRR